MSQGVATSYHEVVLTGELMVSDAVELRKRVFSSEGERKAFKAFQNSLGEATDARTKFARALCWWVIGTYDKVVECGHEIGSSAVAQYIVAVSLLATGAPGKAGEVLKKLASKADGGGVHVLLARAMRRVGDHKAASAALKQGKAAAGDSAEFLVEAGILESLGGEPERAVEKYSEALELDPCCAEALFRLAYMADLHGDNEMALELYQKCARVKPVRINALVNLGLLYEEIGRRRDAVECYMIVVDHDPTNYRAQLYLKDAMASQDMYFDEEQQKRRERRNKILDTPITDFELSVRSRNCLEKMDVTTLGDLTRISEHELLSFKNFGETSLSEIKRMLSSRGLKLGQALEETAEEFLAAPEPISTPIEEKPSGPQILTQPVEELGLTIRSQHCMQMLGLSTVADLVAKSEKELLSAKNFGSTSLAEIRKRLAAHGLALSGAEQPHV